MGNYLYIVADREKAASIKKWAGTDDIRSCTLPGGAEAIYLARGAAKDSRPDGIFKGYAIDHEGEQLIFSGGDASPDVSTPLEGCYFRVQQAGYRTTLSNDLFAQLAMIYFEAPGIVAVSDSLFVLTRLRKFLGLPCKMDAEVMMGRSWINGMSAQLLNDRTSVEGIYFSPPATVLTVDVPGPRLSVERRAAPRVFGGGVECYRETIREGARRTAALIRTMLDIPEASVRLDLSGGVDSRVCLAAGLRAGGGKSVQIGTVPAREDDFPIVKSLSEKFGFPINQPQPVDGQGQTESLDQTGLWMLSCAGIYDPLYAPKRAVRNAGDFVIGGHGAELYKGNFGWRPIHRIARHVPKVSDEFRRQCEAGLECIGIDPRDSWGSEWHYLGYRNALHAGRSTMTSLLGSRPLLQRKLLGLSHSPLNEFPAPRKGAPSIVSDLLMALHPELAAEPFDDPRKDMPKSYIQERSRFLGAMDDIQPYEVVGEPRKVDSGPPAFFERLVNETGFALGRFTKAGISKLADAAAGAIPAELRSVYAPLVDMARHDLADPILAGARPAMAAGKVLAFTLAD
jgi:hypothetical protein